MKHVLTDRVAEHDSSYGDQSKKQGRAQTNMHVDLTLQKQERSIKLRGC